MPSLQYRSLFYLTRIELEDSGIGFEAVSYPTLDPFLFRPVVAGIWTHREAIDGTFTFADLLDAHEMLDVKAANEMRYHAWKQAQR